MTFWILYWDIDLVILKYWYCDILYRDIDIKIQQPSHVPVHCHWNDDSISLSQLQPKAIFTSEFIYIVHQLKNMWSWAKFSQIVTNLWEFGSNSTDFEWWFWVESGVNIEIQQPVPVHCHLNDIPTSVLGYWHCDIDMLILWNWYHDFWGADMVSYNIAMHKQTMMLLQVFHLM